MRWQIRVRYLLALFVALPACLAAEDFYLAEQKVQAPEMGELLSCVLVSGADQFQFLPPLNWRVRTEPERHRVVLEPKDRTALIYVALSGPNPALQTRADAELLRQQVQSRFTGGRIIEEFPCYTGSHTGRGFDLVSRDTSQLQMATRVAYFATPTGTLEISLTTTAAQFRSFKPAFGGLLTSFQQTQAVAGLRTLP